MLCEMFPSVVMRRAVQVATTAFAVIACTAYQPVAPLDGAERTEREMLRSRLAPFAVRIVPGASTAGTSLLH